MVQLPKREESQSEYVIPDEGIYTVVLNRLSEERLGKFADKYGVFHPEQEFYFKIVDDYEFEDCELRVYVRTDTFHDGSGAGQPAKSYLIAKALLGRKFNADAPPDTEELVGLKCQASVTHKKRWASMALSARSRISRDSQHSDGDAMRRRNRRKIPKTFHSKHFAPPGVASRNSR